MNLLDEPTAQSYGQFGPRPMLGVEQEYDLFAGNRQLDFRALFARSLKGTKAVPFRNCDSAAILEAGYMLACDGQEAEFATAPIDIQGDGCLAVAREVMRCRSNMLDLLQDVGVDEIRGYSTHLNISVPPGWEWELAHAFARTVGPALVLLMEARQSPGLLIRPRRGRLEIGSEYIDSQAQLAAAGVFLAGAVQAYVSQPLKWAKFPQVKLMRWEDANIRPGIYLPQDAYGESIYAFGRSACLELERGGTISAGELLRTCTSLVLEVLNGQVSSHASQGLREIADTPGSLQIENEIDPGSINRKDSWAGFPAPQARVLNILTQSHSRLGLTPSFVDWEGVAFSWKTWKRSLVLGVPWGRLPEFFDRVQTNEFPRFVESLGAVRPMLDSVDQLQTPGVFRTLDQVAMGNQALGDKGGSGKNKDHGPFKPTGQIKPPQPRKPIPYIWIGILLLTTILTGITIRKINRNTNPGVERTPTISIRTRGTSTATSTPTPTPTPTFTPTRTRQPYIAPTDTPVPPPPPPPPVCDPAVDPACGPPPPTACTPGVPCGWQPDPLSGWSIAFNIKAPRIPGGFGFQIIFY